MLALQRKRKKGRLGGASEVVGLELGDCWNLLACNLVGIATGGPLEFVGLDFGAPRGASHARGVPYGFRCPATQRENPLVLNRRLQMDLPSAPRSDHAFRRRRNAPTDPPRRRTDHHPLYPGRPAHSLVLGPGTKDVAFTSRDLRSVIARLGEQFVARK